MKQNDVDTFLKELLFIYTKKKQSVDMYFKQCYSISVNKSLTRKGLKD